MEKMSLWNSSRINMLWPLPLSKTWDIMVPSLDQKKMELDNPLRLIAILKDVVWDPLNPRCPLLTTIVWEPNYETKEEELFKVPFQYIEDDLDNHVHAIIVANLSSTNLPLTNLDMIDWDLKDTPPALDIYKSNEAMMVLFGLKNLQDYENGIQYNDEAYFGSHIKSLSCKSKK